MKEMVIKGSEWLRGGTGENLGASVLLAKEGRRCCIGIHARLCGIPDADILEIGAVTSMFKHQVTECFQPWVEFDKVNPDCPDDSVIGASAMRINDDPKTNDEEKIEQLRPIFKGLGIEIVWEPEL